MKPYTQISIEKELALMKEKPASYWYQLETKNKKFIEFGVHHTRNNDHPQFKIIKKIIMDLKPECIIFELTKSKVEELEKVDSKEAILRFLERAIIYGLIPKGTITIGADISRSAMINTKKLTEKYLRDELLMCLILFDIEYLSKKLNKPPKDVLDGALNIWKLKDKEKWGAKVDFYLKKMYSRTLANSKIGDRISATPIDNTCVLNTIERDFTTIRDEHMIMTILDYLQKYDRVIFFVGKNHVLRHEEYVHEFFKEHFSISN